MLKAEMHARMLQNVKLKEERDLLKRKIIELRSEMLKIKEKTWKKQHVEELREKVKKYELQINSQENRSKNINIEVVALREENMHL
jgi:lipid II:glycine glycyltransferase (peptidoglycan interpeptide bridge formation enzyme)